MSKFFLGKLFSGKSKVSPTITKVNPSVPTTKAEKTARDLRRAVQKRKTSEVNLDNTIFKIKQETDKLKKQRDKNKKMGGGFMGKRMGYKGGSEKGKVPTTPKEKAFGMLSVNKGLDNNKNITFTDKIAGATGGKKKKKA
tara:strand:- start:100 stop:519 length:420 start_codon:yes stop_codon:yes gene_type:complete